MSNTIFPLFFPIKTTHFLVVGANSFGLEKLNSILSVNPKANITVVSDCFNGTFINLQEKYPQIKIYQRLFEINDLESIQFLILTTKNNHFNNELKKVANSRGILVDVLMQPKLSDFYVDVLGADGSYSIDNLNKEIEIKRINTNAIKVDENKRRGKLIPKMNKLDTSFFVRNIALLFFVFFVGYGFASMLPVANVKEFLGVIPNEFYYMVAVGFFAQMVDGALGLGYGMTSASAMMAMGIKLPAISGSIHTAEVFSSAISGYTHYKFGNVNKKMLVWLAVPGVIGAVLGSLFVIFIGETYEYIAYPFVAFYLITIAIRLISLAFKDKVIKKPVKRISLLGFSGGFFDAFGGGGWGPIVTSTLLAKGRESKYVVGTVSLAEFFVTFAASITFFTSLGVDYWYVILGLIIGGVLAAPIAAKFVGLIPKKISYILVGLLVIFSGIRIIITML